MRLAYTKSILRAKEGRKEGGNFAVYLEKLIHVFLQTCMVYMMCVCYTRHLRPRERLRIKTLNPLSHTYAPRLKLQRRTRTPHNSRLNLARLQQLRNLVRHTNQRPLLRCIITIAEII